MLCMLLGSQVYVSMQTICISRGQICSRVERRREAAATDRCFLQRFLCTFIMVLVFLARKQPAKQTD